MSGNSQGTACLDKKENRDCYGEFFNENQWLLCIAHLSCH